MLEANGPLIPLTCHMSRSAQAHVRCFFGHHDRIVNGPQASDAYALTLAWARPPINPS